MRPGRVKSWLSLDGGRRRKCMDGKGPVGSLVPGQSRGAWGHIAAVSEAAVNPGLGSG